MRVERGSLLSVPHRGTPRLIVTGILLLFTYKVNSKIGKSRVFRFSNLFHPFYRTLRFHSSFICNSLGLAPESSARKSVSRRLNLVVSSIIGK